MFCWSLILDLSNLASDLFLISPPDQFVLFMPLIKLFNTPGSKLMLAKFLLIGHQDSWMGGRALDYASQGGGGLTSQLCSLRGWSEPPAR